MADLKDSKKFSLHLIDDKIEFVQAVQFALFKNGLCEELLDFMYFSSVGAAINHYEKPGGQSFPDIALIDIDFTDDELPENEKGDLKGFELIEYLNTKARNRTDIFAFTAFTHREEVSLELHLRNLPSQTIAKGFEIDAQVRVPIQMILQKKAAKEIKSLPQEYRHQLTKLSEKFAEFKLPNTVLRGRPQKKAEESNAIQVIKKVFFLPCLLAGWGDVRTMSRAEVQEVVNKILIEKTCETVLKGNWDNPQSKERILYTQYSNSLEEDHKAKFKAIYQKSFDLIIELINIQFVYKASPSINFQLSDLFKGFSVYTTLSEHSSSQCFEDKLIGRLAILTIDHKDTQFVRIDTIKDQYASLLHSAKTNEEISERTVDQVFNTKLGLSFDKLKRKFNTDPEYLFPEEAEFIKTYGPYVKYFAGFIKDMSIQEPLKIHANGCECFNNIYEIKKCLDRYKIPASNKAVKNQKGNIFSHESLKLIEESKRRAIFNLFDIRI